MDRLAIVEPHLVRGLIAREWLGDGALSATLGSVSLRAHQLDAATRLRRLLRDTGGALLCDEVGVGKTYIALAVAHTFARPLVVAPASLRDMWTAAARKCGIDITFSSTESLSRSVPVDRAGDLLIVDEAHHFRTPSTARHRSLAVLAARCPILLVSATPLHNAPADLAALISLFLGSAAARLSPSAVASLIVRRGHAEANGAFPVVRRPVRLKVPHDVRRLEQLLSLPPPVPARDGSLAAAIMAHTLVRLWASSDAALREGLRRRLAKTIAIRQSLESGRYPTRREIEAWSCVEGTVQLGLAGILAAETLEENSQLLCGVIEHERALVALLDSIPRGSPADAARAAHLRGLRRRHPREKIVAFSQFAESVTALYRHMSREPGVAMLTSRGARIASGVITRREALDRFAPLARAVAAAPPNQDISLLITTDLLSEGVNLQDACVVVHLDLPWTAAALEQRVGRVARMESRNGEVHVYTFDPPAPADRLLRAETIIRRKAGMAEGMMGASRIPSLFARAEAPRRTEVQELEAIRRALTAWLDLTPADGDSRPVCAAVASSRDAVLALVRLRGDAVLLGAVDSGISADSRVVRLVVELELGETMAMKDAALSSGVEQARRWLDRALASDDAGMSRFGASLLARRIGERLARDLARCARHARSNCAARIAPLRRRLQSPLTLGVEREIEELLRSPDTTDILASLERIIGTQPESGNEPSDVRAVLVLVASTGSE